MENNSNEANKKEKGRDKFEAIRLIYSRLHLMRGDIEAIERVSIENQAIKGLISGISTRAEILMEMLLGELNKNEVKGGKNEKLN